MQRALISRVVPPAAAIGSALIFAACGGGGGPYGGGGGGSAGASANQRPGGAAPGAQMGAAAVAVGNTNLGKILVDSSGRTLYLFEADTGTQSTCSGACAHAWPALTTSGSPNAGGRASTAGLATTVRSDGTTQVTYHGHPLYHFINDKNAGETNGAGVTAFGARWDVVSASGDRIVQRSSLGY